VDSLDLERYRRALEATRQEQLARLKTLRGEGLGDAAQEAARELSSYDQHPADQGTETFEREKDTGFEAAARGILEQIDEALGRMEAGLYGICAACGEPIDPARLDALPYALRCAPCEAAVEERRRRVVEAAAAPPSFMRGFGPGWTGWPLTGRRRGRIWPATARPTRSRTSPRIRNGRARRRADGEPGSRKIW